MRVDKMKIGIIADDLTSAGDALLPFFNNGYECKISLTGNDHRSQVIGIDVNTRVLKDKQAYANTFKYVAEHSYKDLLIKTIDSTLRGNIKTEIKAAFLASKRDYLVVCPAFPDAGRTTVEGVQYVEGTPVSESKYALDPIHPCKTSCITKLIDQSLGCTVVLPADATLEEVSNALSNFKVIILDASSQEQLNKTILKFERIDNILWVGSPGISYALANAVPFIARHSSTSVNIENVLFTLGSANDVTKQQIKKLDCQCIEIGLNDDHRSISPVEQLAIVTPLERQSSPQLLVNKLASVSASLILKEHFNLVVVSGGESARAILNDLDVEDIEIIHEFESGFPVCSITIPKLKRPIYFAIKAGGFGDHMSLANILNKNTFSASN